MKSDKVNITETVESARKVLETDKPLRTGSKKLHLLLDKGTPDGELSSDTMNSLLFVTLLYPRSLLVAPI